MLPASTLQVHTPACAAMATQEVVKHAQVRKSVLIKSEKKPGVRFCATSWLFEKIFHIVYILYRVLYAFHLPEILGKMIIAINMVFEPKPESGMKVLKMTCLKLQWQHSSSF